jgi:hypothetical protein
MMARFAPAIGMVALLVSGEPAAQDIIGQDVRRPTRTIKGSEQPELITDHVTWLHFFLHFVNYARTDAAPPDEFAPEKVDSLSKHELRIPREDVLAFLKIASDALKRRAAILESEENASAAEIEAKDREADRAILDARDLIKLRLPKRSADLLQWRADVTRRQIEIDVPIKK